jgi:molybdopterin synthase catalytic subunit
MSVRVQTEDFDIGAEVRALLGDGSDAGGIVTFTGTVRGTAKDGSAITEMSLEHYPGMTERELERIEADAHARWPLLATLIVHRVGPLKPGENIVLVIAVSKHRHAAFDAASFLMDYLKTDAPFWKKETGADGVGHWVDARESDDAARERWAR